ncbi:MAG: hypothetical protein V1773_19770 [bacterium]
MNTAKTLFILFFVLTIIIFSSCNVVETKAVIEKNIDTVICTTNATFKLSNFAIINNCWGKDSITNFTQCVNVKKNSKGLDFGFTWQWPSNINNNVKAYPEIVFGWKPWDNCTPTTDLLPINVNSGDTIIVSFDSIETNFNGIGNTSFDLWITSSKTPTSSDVTREIMIWTKNYGHFPGNNIVATVIIDDVEYDLYKNDWTWTFFAFVNKYETEINSINIHKFISYLLSQNYITPYEFLASVEFGNEIVSGSGNTSVKNFKITYKQHNIGLPI